MSDLQDLTLAAPIPAQAPATHAASHSAGGSDDLSMNYAKLSSGMIPHDTLPAWAVNDLQGIATVAYGGTLPTVTDLTLGSTGIGAVDTVLAAIPTKINALLAQLRTAGLLHT